MIEFMSKVALMSMNRVALFALVLTGLYYYSVFDNGELIHEQIKSLQDQINAEGSKKKETEETLAKEKAMREEVSILEAQFQEIKSKIPLEFDQTELRVIVDQLSQASQLKITKTKIASSLSSSSQQGSGVLEAKLVQKIGWEYSFQGNYLQIMNFIKQLGQVEKQIKLSDIKITPLENREGPSRVLQFDAVIVGYKQLPQNPEDVKKQGQKNGT